MKSFFLFSCFVTAAFSAVQPIKAEETSKFVEDTDGDLQPGEYRLIDPNGAVSRAACPFTCEMRGIPKESCREWRSNINKQECYVQDLRISKQDAMPAKSAESHAKP